MKKLSLAFIIGGALILSACNGNSNSDNTATTDSTNTMSSTNNMSDTSNMNNNAMVSDDVKNFSQDAATGGMMEVELGKIAEKNSSTQSIKDFGKMMVDDHSKLNDEFKDLAAKKNVALPSTVTDDQQKDIDKLSKETGKDFDKDYVSMMIDDHKKDIDAFKKANDNITDPDYKNFITNALPTLQKHLDAIEAIDKKM
jgi:putative membrane protein